MSGATGLGAGDGTLPDLDTPDYTDSESNPTGTANSVVGDAAPADGRKRRWEGNALRKTVLGKKHDRLGESGADVPDGLKRAVTLLASHWFDFRAGFGPAFWLGLSMHVVAGELWLRAHPAGARQLRASRT